MSPRPVDKEDRRKAILAAAAEVFAKSGYQRTTVDQIAAAAGVAKGSIYLYFQSKEDLFHALFEDIVREASVPAENDGSIAGPRGLEGVRRALLDVVAAIDRDDSVIPLTLEFWSVCGVEETRERFGQSYAKSLTAYRTRIVDMLNDAKSRGEMGTDVSSEAVASCLIAMIDGLLIQQWTVPGVKASAILQQALPVLLRAVRLENDS